MEEHLPRSQQTVERYAAQAIQRIRRRANTVALSLVIGGVLAFVYVLAKTYNASDWPSDGVIAGAVAALLLTGWVPAYALRRYLLAGTHKIRDLLSLGFAYPGVVTSRSKIKDTHFFSITWREGDREVQARVPIAGRAPVDTRRSVTVLARKDCRDVAVLFGDEVFLGRR